MFKGFYKSLEKLSKKLTQKQERIDKEKKYRVKKERNK